MIERAIYPTLGAAVSARRRVLKLTQAAVAKKIGVSRESIANIEAGRQRVLLHHVYGLMRALDLKAITELIPASLPRQTTDVVTTIEMSGATLSDSQRSEIERLLSGALREQPIEISS